MTAADASCPAKTDCVSYTLAVAAANPSVGAFSTSGTQQPAAPASGPVGYTVDAVASLTGGTDCTPSGMQTSSTVSNASLTVAAGTSVTAATLAFLRAVSRLRRSLQKEIRHGEFSSGNPET